MPRFSEAQSFDRTISQLISKRDEYAQGLAEIDALFEKYGIQVNRAPSSSPRKGPIGRRTSGRKRRSFSETAHELVLSIVKTKSHPTTRDINVAWKKAGRGGTADNTIGNLVKDKKLKRTPVKDGRGSTYAMA